MTDETRSLEAPAEAPPARPIPFHVPGVEARPLPSLPGLPPMPRVPGAMRSSSGMRDLFANDVKAGRISPFTVADNIRSIDGARYQQLANGQLVRVSGKVGRRKSRRGE